MGYSIRHILVIMVATVALLAIQPSYAQLSAFEDPKSSTPGAAAVGSQEFSPVKSEIEGGDIPLGQTIQVIVMMRNNTNAPLAIEKIDLVPSSNITATLSGNQCGTEEIKPGIECPLTVSIKAEMSGKYRVGILVSHTGRSKISNVAISGTIAGSSGGGMPSNEVEAFPGVLDFEKVKGRAPLVRSIALRNTSTKPLDITNIELKASPLTGFVVSAPDCKTLAPSQSCIATMTWTPQVEGKSEGVLVLTHTGPSGSLQIPIVGEYERTKTEMAERFPAPIAGQGLIIADRESVEFGSAVDGAASITVSLINTGDNEVTLNQVKLAGSDNGLSLSTDDCANGKILKPYEGCALTVNWLPRRKGPVIDDIQIIHTGARGVLVLPVRGTATEPVSLSVPLMPKVSRTDLDESLVGKDSGKKGGVGFSGDAASLNGYRVTSLSANRAVIAGPRGRLVVTDGVTQVIAGGSWTPHVTHDGVEMVSGKESVFLLFDRILNLTSDGGGGGNFATTTAAPVATTEGGK